MSFIPGVISAPFSRVVRIFAPSKLRTYKEVFNTFHDSYKISTAYKITSDDVTKALQITPRLPVDLGEVVGGYDRTLKDFLKKQPSPPDNRRILNESITPDDYSFRESRDNYNQALESFTTRVSIINDQIEKGNIPNYESLARLLKREQVRLRKAITAYQAKELEAAKGLLAEKKTNKDYRREVAKFYDLELDVDTPDVRDALDNKIDALHDKHLENLKTTQQKELKGFDDEMAKKLGDLHEHQLNEEQRIAFFARMVKNLKDADANALKDKTLESEPLKTRSGLSINYDPKKKQLSIYTSTSKIESAAAMLAKKLPFVGDKAAAWLLHETNLDRDLNDLMAAAKGAGIKPIKISVTHDNPEKAEELARKAYAAAIKLGYSHEDIQMELPNKTESRRQLEKENKEEAKKDPKDWIFNGHGAQLDAIKNRGELLNQYRKNDQRSPEVMKKQQEQIDTLSKTIDNEERQRHGLGQ